MQLNRQNVRQALALATCALVHGSAQAAEGDWKLSGALLSYEEVERVSVSATALSATRDLGDESSVTVRGVYDSLTGASPNGASATTTAQTFTGASGAAGYTTPAYKLPLKEFEDTRVAAGVDWSKRTSATTGRTLTVNVSKEEDYFSLGGSGTWTRDLNQKLTTLALGVGLSLDTVLPQGGAPTALSSIHAMPAAQTTTCASGTARIAARDSDEDEGEEDDGGCEGEEDTGEQKTTLDLLFGATQVLTRRTLTQFNYTLSHSDGYLTDPYKLVSIVDPVTGATVDYVYEKRPSERLAHVFYWKLLHNFDHDVAHLSYRYFQDDWGIQASTVELQYHLMLGENWYLEPQYRVHRQDAADFYHHSLPSNATGVDFASADLRLGAMTSTTVGLKLGARVGDGEFSIRAAHMVQEGDSHPADAIGVQTQVDLYPKLEANIVNLGFSLPL